MENIAGALLLLAVTGATEASSLQVQNDEGCPDYDCGDNEGLPLEDVKPSAVTASSTLASKSDAYAAANASDHKDATAWCEGVKGLGVGEWLRYEFAAPIALQVLRFEPFYAKDRRTLAANGRVKRLRVEMEGGFRREAAFDDARWCPSDEPGACQLQYPAPYVFLKAPVRTSWVKLTILEVWKPGKYEDTCISSLDVMALKSEKGR
jgi:hypothetical protein